MVLNEISYIKLIIVKLNNKVKWKFYFKSKLIVNSV